MAWRKSRDEREREYHEAMAQLEADQAELAAPDAEGPARVFVRSVAEETLLLLGAAAICVVGAVVGVVVGGPIGLVVGFVAGLVVCGVVAVVAFGWGLTVLRRRR